MSLAPNIDSGERSSFDRGNSASKSMQTIEGILPKLPGSAEGIAPIGKVTQAKFETRANSSQSEIAEAVGLICSDARPDPVRDPSDEEQQHIEERARPDSWLIAAIARDPPAPAALDALVARHWRRLYSHCRLLASNEHAAEDLAQSAWYRILRSRSSLRPDGNFSAYLSVVATNLWRDRRRGALRAGALAADRLISLDAATGNDSTSPSLLDLLPDLETLRGQEEKARMAELYEAIEQLSPTLRDVIAARFLVGESCAEIGLKYHRSEQTITAWIRQAVRLLKEHLESNRSNPTSMHQT